MQLNKGEVVGFTKKFTNISNVLYTQINVCSFFNKESNKDLIGIWDTGATGCSINKKYADELKLPAVGMCQVSTAGGIVSAMQHLMIITLPNKQKMTILVTATDLGDTDFLIGMDVIAQGDFAVTNFNGRTILNYRQPSVADIDFVQQMKNLDTVHSNKKTGRNEQCPCGSGKKYKNCCGRNR